MNVYYDSMQGPQRCKVIAEVDGEFVTLRPVSHAGGPFGGIEPSMRDFTTTKSMCWMRARSMNKYGTRYELSGRPEWALSWGQ